MVPGPAHGEDDDRLERGSVQLTRAQWRWLRERGRRLGLQSVTAIVRMLVQEAMLAEYRAGRVDVEVEP